MYYFFFSPPQSCYCLIWLSSVSLLWKDFLCVRKGKSEQPANNLLQQWGLRKGTLKQSYWQHCGCYTSSLNETGQDHPLLRKVSLGKDQHRPCTWWTPTSSEYFYLCWPVVYALSWILTDFRQKRKQLHLKYPQDQQNKFSLKFILWFNFLVY